MESPSRHSHSRRKLLIWFICCLLATTMLSSIVQAAPSGSEQRTPTLERLVESKDSLKERVGSPIELAWQAWLILSKSEKGQLLSEDPATLVRRITPKSIFIAPELNNGCSGQNYDENRCKHIKTISINTSLQRKFLLDRLNAMHDRQKQEQDQQGKVYDFAGPFQFNIPFNDANTHKPLPSPLDTKNTTPIEDELVDTTPKAEEPLPEHVPVVDFVHEEEHSNESFDSSVVDYKIPSPDSRRNVSNASEDSTTAKPTLIVLFDLSTKTSSEETTVDRNSTSNLTGTISIPPRQEEHVNLNATHQDDEAEKHNTSPVPEEEEEEDNLEDYSTDDDFAETTDDDELLRPGEAGMTIPMITNQQFDKTEWRQEEEEEEATTTEMPPSSTVPTEAEGSTIPEGDNISSEVSINGDFIMETTLVDVNTEKITKNATERNVEIVTAKVEPSEAPATEKFESELVPKPELVFSTSQEETPPIKPVIVWGIDEETAKKQNLELDPVKVDLGLLPVQKDDSMIEQASFNSERIALPDSSPKFQHLLPPINYKPPSSFVRFPSQDFPSSSSSSSYVRFPSDEVNSIHSQDFKPRLPHDFVSTTSTKSSVVPFYPKQWRRGSRQHPVLRAQPWNDSVRLAKLKQQANEQNFWAKLTPSVPDLVHLPAASRGSNNEPFAGDTLRRSSLSRSRNTT